MPYCPRCGVQLSDTQERCPLCHSPRVLEKPAVAESGGLNHPSHHAVAAAEEALNSSERRLLAVELISVILGGALIVTLLVDLFFEHGFTWSWYSSVGIVTLWLVSALPMILWRHPWVLFSALAPSLILMVFLLDLADGELSWFLRLGLPLSVLLEGTAAASGALIAVSARKGLNVIAVILAALAVFCVGLELILNVWLSGRFFLRWSVIVSLAVIPSSALLFYLHFRIMNRSSLRKLFRL